MDTNKKVTFEEIFEQNERRIHYHIHRLRIQDTHQEFYVEGLHAMWQAYKKYEPDKGTLATYFNYSIRNRLIDLLRKKTRDQSNEEKIVWEESIKNDDGNRNRHTKQPIIDVTGITLEDWPFWDGIQSKLSVNQWKWVYYYIVLDMPVKVIARQENVSVDAVKSWGQEARKKLRRTSI